MNNNKIAIVQFLTKREVEKEGAVKKKHTWA